MSLTTKILGWGAALAWVGWTAYYIPNAQMKLSFRDLLLMMPQCCQMTDLAGTGHFALTPEMMIKFCFVFIVMHTVTTFLTAEAVIEQNSDEVTDLEYCVFTKGLEQKNGIEEVLLENAKLCVDNADFEFKHCAALINYNNEFPGKRVGGEVEWATGETSSEDEDATREIIGAHIKKPRETEDEKIMRCLTYPNDDSDDSFSIKSTKEPNVTNHICDEQQEKSEARNNFVN